MSRFNPNATDKSPEEWSAIALQKSSNTGTQYTTIGGIVLALWVGSSAGLIPGLLVLAWSIYFNFERAKGSSRNCEAIAEEGCIAHALPEREFRAYARQIGQEKILEEIEYAVQEKLPVSDHAKKLYLNSPRKVLPLPAVEPAQDAGSESDRLLQQIAERVENSMFIGLPGAGKGMLVSNAIRRIKNNPNFKVFVIDPKANYRELGYWQGIADVYERRCCENLPPQMVEDWISEKFQQFNQWHQENNNERSLLFLDEAFLIGSKLEIIKSTLIKDKIISLDSQGSVDGRHIWIASQTPYIKGLGIDLSTSSLLKPYAIVHKSNLSTLQQWSRAATIKPIDSKAASELIALSECDRMVFTPQKAQWQPMPVLENYSSFNRDKREATVPHGELDKLKAARKNFAGSDAEFLEEIGCPLEMRQRILEEMKNW